MRREGAVEDQESFIIISRGQRAGETWRGGRVGGIFPSLSGGGRKSNGLALLVCVSTFQISGKDTCNTRVYYIGSSGCCNVSPFSPLPAKVNVNS